jgi:hypothetical protein
MVLCLAPVTGVRPRFIFGRFSDIFESVRQDGKSPSSYRRDHPPSHVFKQVALAAAEGGGGVSSPAWIISSPLL